MKWALLFWGSLIIELLILLALFGCSPCPDYYAVGCAPFPTAAPRQ